MFLRVLRTAKATLSRTFYLDEAEASATGDVVVTVTRLDGTPVESGTAVADGEGGYTYEFGGRDVLDELVLSWAATVGGDAIVLDADRIEIVGGFYFGLAEARDIDRVLQDTAKHPTEKLIERRVETEDECERITGQAWVPRFCRETVTGYGSGPLQMSWPFIRAIRSVSVDGVAFDTGGVAALTFSELGLISRSAAWPWVGQVTVEYEHGHDRPNSEIARAAKLRFKSLMLEGNAALPDRAERVVTVDQSGGSTIYSSPTAEKTGIPAVDAVYGRYHDARPGFG